MAVDLHLHTHHSDGSWSPRQLVEEAIKLRFRHIAITDHDTTAGIAEATEVAGDQIEIIPGIEINTVLKRDGQDDFDVHILGYFITAGHSALEAVIAKQQEARLRLVDDAVVKLNSLGINLTHEAVRECAGEGSIGRPHITKAIVQVGGARSITKAYERFMDRNSEDYIARFSVTPQDAIKAITEAGGLASIAHPGKGDEICQTILELKEAGLHGVEAYHRSHGIKLVKRYIKFATANKMLVTGGSDCHGPSHGYPASIGSIRVPLDVLYSLRGAVAVNC